MATARTATTGGSWEGETRTARRTLSLPSLREQECDREAESPVRAALRALGVVTPTKLELDRLSTDPHELADCQVDRHRPLAGLPVAGGFGVEPEGRVGRGRVGDEGLEERVADVGAISIAGKRPDVVGEETIGPAVILSEHDGRRTRPPLPRAKSIVAGGWIKEHRAAADDPSVERLFRGEEEALFDIADAPGAVTARDRR